MWTCIVITFVWWNQPEAPVSQIYSWNENLHVSYSFSVHHQEFFTVHTAMVCVIEFCWQLANRIRMVPSWFCSPAFSRRLWHTPLLCVKWKTPDYGQRNCPKHVDFHSKNKSEKLVYLVVFIIRILTRCTVTWTSNLSKFSTSTTKIYADSRVIRRVRGARGHEDHFGAVTVVTPT